MNENKLKIPFNCNEEIKNELFQKNELKNSSYNPYKEDYRDFSKIGNQSTNYN